MHVALQRVDLLTLPDCDLVTNRTKGRGTPGHVGSACGNFKLVFHLHRLSMAHAMSDLILVCRA
jgi:hypothetical protein